MAKAAAAKKEKPAKVDKGEFAELHHSTINKANEADIALNKNEDGSWTATQRDDETLTATADTGKKAVDAVLKEIKSRETAAKKAQKEAERAEKGEDSQVVKDEYKKRYAPNGGNCGDALAKIISEAKEKEPEKGFAKICKENKIDGDKWSHLNTGMQWMNLRNVLRNRLKRGEPIFVLGEELQSEKEAA